jgi:hypothetical protein
MVLKRQMLAIHADETATGQALEALAQVKRRRGYRDMWGWRGTSFDPFIEVKIERITGTALASEGVHVSARAVVVECAVVLTGPIVSTDIWSITADEGEGSL